MPKIVSDTLLTILLFISLSSLLISGGNLNQKKVLLLCFVGLFIFQTFEALGDSRKIERMYYVFLPLLFIISVRPEEIKIRLLNDLAIQRIALFIGIVFVIKCYPVIGAERLLWEEIIGLNVISVSRYALILLLIINYKSYGKRLRLIALIVQILLLALIFLGQTRGILLPLGMCLLLSAIGRYGYIKSFVILPLVYIPSKIYLAARFQEFENIESVGRWINIQRGLELFRKAPLNGIGAGNWRLFSDTPYPHNIFVEVLVELGVIGGALIVFLYFGWFLKRRQWFSLTRIEILSFCLIADSMVSGNLSMNIHPILFAALGFL